MVTFRITFLLAFSLVSKNKNSKENKSKKGGKGKIKNSKKSKSSKSSKSRPSKRNVKPEGVPKPDYLLEVGNPMGYAHIEYEFMPGRDKQQIDVICWKGVAKVFFEEETVTYRARIASDKIWVPVFIEHYVNTLESDELVKLHSHEINFIIYTNKNKLNSRAKSVSTKLFYLRQEDVNVDDFVQVYTEDPNLSVQEPDNDLLVNYIHDIINDCINKPLMKNKSSVASKLKTRDIVHTHRVNKVINEISDGKFMSCKEFVPISLAPIPEPVEEYEEDMFQPAKKRKKSKNKSKKNKAAKKGSKKGTKDKKLSAGQIKIKVSGEVFFTDPNLSMYDCKITNNVISNAYVLISVEKLLTKWQKYELNPMVIKIDNIFNVPVEFLKQNGFKSLFVRYNIPYVARGTTLEREIAVNTIINEAHAHFTNDIPEIKFSEFMQSKRLLIEICGTRDQTTQKEVKPYIFGAEKNDKNISKKFSSEQALHNVRESNDFALQPIIVLAVAHYDLTSLLTSTWTLVSNESCHVSDTIYEMKKINRKINFVTPSDINLCVLRKPRNYSPLTEALITKCGMSLKVEVCMAAPIYKLMNKVLSCGDFYKRLFVIIYKYELAVYMLKEILTNNTKDFVLPNYLHLYNSQDLDESDYITGFLIDNGNSYAFFIEGFTHGLIMTIWEKFMFANPYDVHIFFNNNVVFENRLYDKFLNLGGIFMITLLQPLRDILALEQIYLEGTVPLPCFQALKKLDLLLRCSTLKDILQANFLPTPDELVSLDLEFGVPLRWNKSRRTISQVLSNK